jgi:hypothetical protein
MRTLFVTVAVCAFVASGCSSNSPDPSFTSVEASVHDLGLRLGYDLVDGGYTVYAKEADDQVISKAVEHLKELGQGKSITELDHERRFSFFLSSTSITDDAIRDILALQVTQVRLNDTKVTEESLIILQNAPHLRVLVVGANQFSDEDLHKFSSARPEVVIMNPE